MCLCVSVCLCVYVCVSMCVCLCVSRTVPQVVFICAFSERNLDNPKSATFMYKNVQIYIHIYIYTHIQPYKYICEYIYIYIYINIHTYTHTYTYIRREMHSRAGSRGNVGYDTSNLDLSRSLSESSGHFL